MSDEILEAAQRYAQYRGWHVFPVDGKRPLVAWRDESTTDPGKVHGFWARWPTAGIGIDCGPSGLAVVDVDHFEGLHELEDKLGAELPETLTAQTGGGGVHYYYIAPHPPVRNSAGKLAEGVDVRGEGGFVVAPPSPHPTGQHYQWSTKAQIATWPDALTDLLADDQPESTVEASADPVAMTRWGERVLEGEVGKVATAPEGRRNNQLFESALKVFGAVKGGHIKNQIAYDQLQLAALRAGLPLGEIETTLASAEARADARNPDDDTPEPEPEPTTVSSMATRNDVEPFTTLSREQLTELPPPRWLLEDNLLDGLTLLYGKESTGKSFVALDWAAAIAHHTNRLVLYFAGEGISGYPLRLEAWDLAHPEADAASLHLVPRCPRLVDRRQRARLAATVGEHRPVLGIIDTWARALAGGEENSASDVGQAVGLLDELRHEYGTAWCIIHHEARAGNERGSTALPGAVDMSWRCRSPHPDQIDLYVAKPPKDARAPQSQARRLRPTGPSAIPYPTVLQQGKAPAHLVDDRMGAF